MYEAALAGRRSALEFFWIYVRHFLFCRLWGRFAAVLFSSFFVIFCSIFIFPAPCPAVRRQRIGAAAADRALFFTQTLFFA
jgi:hypothetical protein